MKPSVPSFWLGLRTNNEKILLPRSPWSVQDTSGSAVLERLKEIGHYSLRVRIKSIYDFSTERRSRIRKVLKTYNIKTSRKEQVIIMASNYGYWVLHIDPELFNMNIESVKIVRSIWDELKKTQDPRRYS